MISPQARLWGIAATVITSAAVLGMQGCEPSVPAGRIRIKNDSRDSEYNVVNVSGGGASCTLAPGKACVLPKDTTSISFSRAYRDFTRYYEVECPTFKGAGFTIKLIDVHLNRMRGGCKTVSASKG